MSSDTEPQANGTTETTEVTETLVIPESTDSTERTEEEAAEPLDTPTEAEGKDEDDDDDDFGDFSDASFDDFEEPQQTTEEPLTPATAQSPSTPIQSTHSAFPQSLFDDDAELTNKLDELCHVAFPGKLEPFQVPHDISLLNERSTHLLERLVAKPYLKPYNWKRGSLRRQLLVTLGLPEDNVVQRQRTNEFDIDGYVVRKLEELKIDENERKKIIEGSEAQLDELSKGVLSEEELGSMDEAQLAEAIEKLQADVEKAERFLSVWDDERAKLEEDHRTYESVVENLVGHTQRLRREEALKSLKKEGQKGKLALFKKKITNKM